MNGNGVHVAKRDGSIESFSISKLRSALTRVLRTSECDAKLAEPLAKAVAVHLEDWEDQNPPSTDYVFRCVRQVLEQTGLDDAAREFARQRRIRDERRKSLRVVDRDAPGQRFAPWRKAEVFRSLQKDYGIGSAAARFLAGRTEDQVFALNYRLISKTLIAELIRNELLAWGLADERPRSADPASAIGP